MPYDAFISYSHRQDQNFATALQSALHKLGKPWYRLRQLNTFRDVTDLKASPELWSNIEKALDASSYLIILASPLAAQSKWVKQEIEYWIKKKPLDRIIFALTSGEIVWDDAGQDFDWVKTSALPELMKNRIKKEGLYIDFVDIQSSTDLSLNNPEFKTRIAKISAKIQDIDLKELIDRDVTEHRKTLRIRNAVIFTMTVFLICLSIAVVNILQQRNEAIKVSNSGNLVFRALNHNSDTETLLNLYEAYQLNPSPFIANLLVKYGTRPTTFYDWILMKDSLKIKKAIFLNNRFVVAGGNGVILILDKKGKKLVEKKTSIVNLDGMAFIKEKKTVVVWGRRPTGSGYGMCILNAATLQNVVDIDLPAEISSLEISEDQSIVTGDSEGIIRNYNYKGQFLNNVFLDATQHSINKVFRDKTGNYITLIQESSETNKKTIELFSKAGKLIGQFKILQDKRLKAISYDSEHGWLIATDEMGVTYRWDKPGSPVHVYNPYEKGLLQYSNTLDVGKCFFSPSGTRFAVIINSNCIIWDVDGTILATAFISSQRTDMVEFDTKEDLFYTAENDGDGIIFWSREGLNIRSQKTATTIPRINSKSKDEYVLQKNGVFEIYDIKTDRLRLKIKSLLTHADYFDYNSKGDYLFTKDSAFQISTKKENYYSSKVLPTKIKLGKVTLDNTSSKFYSILENGNVFKYDLIRSEGEEMSIKKEGVARIIAVNTDGDLLVGGGSYRKGFLIYLKSDISRQVELKGHANMVNDVKFSDDGKQIASVDDNGMLIVWDAKKLKEKFRIQASLEISMEVEISNDNNYFLTTGALLNEISVVDRFGNKIQSETFNTLVTLAKFIDGNKFRVWTDAGNCSDVYLLPGFIGSGRILSSEKLKSITDSGSVYSLTKSFDGVVRPIEH